MLEQADYYAFTTFSARLGLILLTLAPVKAAAAPMGLLSSAPPPEVGQSQSVAGPLHCTGNGIGIWHICSQPIAPPQTIALAELSQYGVPPLCHYGSQIQSLHRFLWRRCKHVLLHLCNPSGLAQRTCGDPAQSWDCTLTLLFQP